MFNDDEKFIFFIRQNGVRSMHPLQVVREKCPQLLIDAFIEIIDNKKK